MKNSKLDKFSLMNRINNKNSIIVGASGSDVTFTDSKRDNGSYDVAVLSLIDTIDSSTSLDRPA